MMGRPTPVTEQRQTLPGRSRLVHLGSPVEHRVPVLPVRWRT